MKKVILVISLLFLNILTYGQVVSSPDMEIQEPLLQNSRVLYASIGTGMDIHKNLDLGAEFGIWGIKKKTSYSLTFDAVRDLKSSDVFAYWGGVKTYYTLFDNGKSNLMIYIAPKFELHYFDWLIENGFNFNYVLSDIFMLGSTLAFQSSNGYLFTPSFSIGLVILLQNTENDNSHHRKLKIHHKK